MLARANPGRRGRGRLRDWPRRRRYGAGWRGRSPPGTPGTGPQPRDAMRRAMPGTPATGPGAAGCWRLARLASVNGATGRGGADSRGARAILAMLAGGRGRAGQFKDSSRYRRPSRSYALPPPPVAPAPPRIGAGLNAHVAKCLFTTSSKNALPNSSMLFVVLRLLSLRMTNLSFGISYPTSTRFGTLGAVISSRRT